MQEDLLSSRCCQLHLAIALFYMVNIRLQDESSRKQTMHRKNLQYWTRKIRFFCFVPCHGFSKGLELF
ncbi:hypothetical protein OIU79_018297 [Salix purpurea]|uniref:Uncharacterized protein n=1 Tax=Salix purpurea TaxID=77065 RepID=A0A9Q0WXR1_SALPP|nr:hypothetical protein OIU79_018297 [Salix purpurea]